MSRHRVPHIGTVTKLAGERAKQATTDLHPTAVDEIDALDILTQAGCSSTPTLLVWKQEKQTEHDWIPGGYIVYVLMNKFPGIQVPWITHLCAEEQQAFHDAFKKAWVYVLALPVITLPCLVDNI